MLLNKSKVRPNFGLFTDAIVLNLAPKNKTLSSNNLPNN